MKVKLSRRLERIASHVHPDARLADIGSDHALLPVWLVQTGKIQSAVAGEVNDGPWLSAYKQVQSSRLGDAVSVRKGDGLQVVAPGEVDTVVIAGMGGSLICSILERGREVLSQVERMILQPNVGEKTVRRWLLDEHWALVGEEMVVEDGLYYEILVAERSPDADAINSDLYRGETLPCGLDVPADWLLEMGPYLLRDGGKAFVAKWERERRKLDRILDEIKQADHEQAKARKHEFVRRRNQISEVLQCLSTVHP